MERILLAKIALSSATYGIDKPYDYLVPPELSESLKVGMRVLVPFGAGNRRVEGIVLSLLQGERLPGLKQILTRLDEHPVLDEELLRLALWMRERYFCTVYDAAKAMLPAGLYFSIRDSYRIREGINTQTAYAAAGKSERARKVLDLLYANNESAEIGQIRAAFGVSDPMPALKVLLEQGVLELDTACTRGVADKKGKVASLALPPEEAMEAVRARRKTAPLRYSVVELLASVGSASVKELCYFTGASMATIRSLSKSGLITLEEEEQYRRVEMAPVLPAGPVMLNEEQQKAFEGLDELARQGKAAAALLYGVTGSGKTQVYIKLIQAVLERGKSAMILVPEIALTPQLLRIFTSHFGDDIAVLHSSLKAGERYDEWKRVRSGLARVVIGTRSAVFAPVRDLGLLIVDEEQESTYKSESTPRYHAVEVAKYRCVQQEALLLLGSATPSVESYYQAQKGIYHLFSLHRRFNDRALPQVLIADLKKDLKAGNGGSLSRLLKEELEKNILAGEQSILFLNRRGANRMLTCVECGQVFECPRCSVYLTYHSANHRLMCHHCGYSEPKPERCSACGGTLELMGAGTQRVEEELRVAFPGVEILRMDADTINASQNHDKLLSRFREEKIPILLGTQMVAKGLDFENVTLVGVLAADLSLYVDDYRAGERTFSLLTQVVGRAGRGSKPGRAVIQTWTPENEVITLAAKQDYDGFYEQEIMTRRLRGLPPYVHLFVLTASGTDEHAVLHTCQRLRSALETILKEEEYRSLGVKVLGPAPASVAKVNNRYRYRLTLNGPNTRQIRKLIAYLVRAAQKDKENKGVSVFADMDPLD